VFVSCLAGLTVGCQSGSKETSSTVATSNVAATVNGEPITLNDFNEHTDLKQSAQIMSPQGPTETRIIGSFGLQSMQELVDQKVLLQMAKEQGVSPTSADIDQEMKLQSELRPDYLQVLHDQGMNDEAVRHQIEVGLARQHIIMKGVEVSSTEVDDYIKKNPKKFSDPAMATLYFVLAKNAQKKGTIDQALAAGKPFSQVANALSDEPNARTTSGLYATKVIDQMPPKLKDLIQKTPAKGTTPWVPEGTGFVKFYVENKVESKAVKVSDSKREMVKRLLALQKGETKNNFSKMFYDKLKASKVEVQVPHLKDQWKKTWDQLSDPVGVPGGK